MHSAWGWTSLFLLRHILAGGSWEVRASVSSFGSDIFGRSSLSLEEKTCKHRELFFKKETLLESSLCPWESGSEGFPLYSNPRLPNHGTVNIWGWTLLRYRGCPVHCRGWFALSLILTPWMLAARTSLSPAVATPKSLQTLPTVPCRQNLSLLGVITPELHSQLKLTESSEYRSWDWSGRVWKSGTQAPSTL